MGVREALRGGRARERADLLEAELGRRDLSLDLLNERIAELELALEDEGWTELGLKGAQEFSRSGLRKLVSLARVMFLKNPLIHRAVMVQAYYVFGQGVTLDAADDEARAIVEEFWSDPANRAELTSAQNLELKEIELQVSGNLFLSLFTTPSTGRVRVRSFPVAEVSDVIHNPEDRREPWFYLREWRQEHLIDNGSGAKEMKPHKALYPDWRYRPTDRPPSFAGIDVRWDSPVMHVRVGMLDGMRFGLPDFYSTIDWARAYKEFLEDWASLVRSLSRFAWRLSAKGGKKGRDAAKKKLNTTLGIGKDETNPPPTPGAVFVGDPDSQLAPIPKTGASTTAEDGKQLRLMVAAGTDIPDTILSGDVDQGNFATSKTLDRPTELAMGSRQTLWSEVFSDLAEFALMAAVEANRLPGELAPLDSGVVLKAPDEADYSVTVTFPPILEHDTKGLVEAITMAATLGGKPEAGTLPRRKLVELLLSALRVTDTDAAAVLDELDIPEGAPEPETEAQFTEALRELREYIDRAADAA